ncbi:glycosyltransferase [Candidatus Saccharibacteria bacterium]|nr:glycosyltransferase [Candidatus Saccharibacteria bacterium]
MTKEKTILTIGVTAHAEGALAHKTIRSIFAALEELDTEKYPYEIIVHIDNGDEPTNNYFDQYKNDKRFKIIHSSFKDLGMSRNCIAQHAKGKYISFLDADDMLSSNWYVSALKRIEESPEPIMIHPNIQFNFGAGTRPEFTWRKDSYEKFEDAIILAGVNRWCSAIMGPTEIFRKYPYMKTERGYGYEDYNLNSNTVGHGVKHMVAPETVMFYRQKAEGSLLTSSNTEHVIQPYVSLLDIDYFKSIPKDEVDKMRPRTARTRHRTALYKVYKKIRSNSRINYFIIPVAKMTKRALGIGKPEDRPRAKVPKFMLEEWKKINEIESQLYPTKEVLSEVVEAEPDDYSVGLVYYDLVKQIPALPDYIFIVPWVRTGGADKALCNYIKSISKQHPDWKVAVITTLPVENTKAEQLPKNAYIIDYGNKANALWEPQKEMLFSRLIAQLKCNNIHIINSEYGYLWAASHKKFISSNVKLDVSIFSITNQYAPEIGNYANPYLLNIYPFVNKIYTDNQNTIKELIEKEGFDQDKMRAIYQPVDINKDQSKEENEASKEYRILWASRIDHEKLPSVAKKVAKLLNEEDFKIDFYGELASDFDSKYLNTGCGRYKGKFSGGLQSINTSKYDAFLYTSNRDGLPNILLEAAAKGLPIVASNIGGISDFVKDHASGLLVDDIEDPSAYARAIKELKERPDQAKKYIAEAHRILKEQHSWQKFFETTKNMFDK